MILPEESLLLRVYISENDKVAGRPLYEKIVLKARELNMAGATVLRGLAGFGAHSRIHSAKLLTLSEDLPLVIEIVDREDRIETLIPFLDENVKSGLVTLEKVQIIKYRHEKDDI